MKSYGFESYLLAMGNRIFEYEIKTYLKTAGNWRAFVIPSRVEPPLLDGAEGRCLEVALRIRLVDGRFNDTSINIDCKLQYDKSFNAASACIFWISWLDSELEMRRILE